MHKKSKSKQSRKHKLGYDCDNDDNDVNCDDNFVDDAFASAVDERVDNVSDDSRALSDACNAGVVDNNDNNDNNNDDDNDANSTGASNRTIRDDIVEDFVVKIERKFDDRINTRHKRGLADGFKKNKVVNEVLDKSTVMTLYKMITSGVLSAVNGSISAGKESLVFWGLDSAGVNVALKIYLTSTSNFKRRQEYVLGDPRFTSVKKGTRNMVYLWAKKEFRNLKQCFNAGIPVPKPIHVANNVLVMEFISSLHAENDTNTQNAVFNPAVQLLHSSVNYDDYQQALTIIIDMYKKANLVHGDYSEYNIFKDDSRGLIVFDLGSAVHKSHPNSAAFLQRDINNIVRFFKKKGVKVDDGDGNRIMEELLS